MSKYLDKIPFVGFNRTEEWISSISHMVGGGFGIIVFIHCLVKGIIRHNPWYIVTGIIYSISMIAMYTCSAVYHGLYENKGKKVMRLVDHTMVYFLISGTITPYALVTLRQDSKAIGWSLFGFAWACTLAGALMVFIDFEKTKIPQMIITIGEGWMVIVIIRKLYVLLSPAGFYLLLAGGICYTVGAILYGIGSKHRYWHSVFHFFVIGGTVLHFISIILYVFK